MARTGLRMMPTFPIAYPEGWTGTLIYIKASLTGDEPADLQAYVAKHKCFPHQSTANQFFEESQFESYHRLRLHTSKEVFQSWSPEKCEWQGKPEVKRSPRVPIGHMGQPDVAARSWEDTGELQLNY